MVFDSGWSRSDIDGLTYKELFEYVGAFDKLQAEREFDFWKAFSIYNCESTTVGTHGKRSERSNYLNSVKRKKMIVNQDEDDHFDNQFDGD